MPKAKKHHDEDDSDNQSEDDSDNQLKINTDNSPKIIPVAKLPDKLKYKKIVLNVSDTQYPIITEIGEELGWIIQDQQGPGDWDIWWTDRQIEPNTLYRMNLHQKINHFPGIYVLARKNLLGLHLMAMQKKFPNEYNFFPQTWMLPMQFPQFRQFYQSVEQGKARTYIVKPQALSQGRGIFLTRSIEDVLNGNKYVVQKYLKNPLLLDGLKFDLRIYVLLAGSEPLRLYIYEQGLARLATKPYEPPTAQNLHQNYIHLTNYSLNKTNPDYVYNKSDKQMDVGHKRSLKGVYQKLAKTGIDMQKLKTQIEDCIIKTVISGLPSIRHQYRYCQPEQYQGNMCFHILGFDVMIMEDLKPIVIQVNHTPSFETGTPLDYQIKKNLIKDTLKLMRTTQKQKKALFLKSKQLTKIRIQTGKRNILKGQERQQHLAKIQKLRDQQEKQILNNPQKPSGYKAIYPFQDEKKNQIYAKFFEGAQQVMKEQKDMRKKIICEDEGSPRKQTVLGKKNSKHSRNSSIKDFPPQKIVLKKQISNPKSDKELQKSQPRQKNLDCSANSSSQSKIQKKKLLNTDMVIQTNEQNLQTLNQKQCNPNKSIVTSSEKKIIYSSVNKGIFQIRNNKFGRKSSLNSQGNQKVPMSPTPNRQQNISTSQNPYEQLMDKFVKSKDLEDPYENCPSLQGRILLEQKFNCSKKSRNTNDQDFYAKDQGSINYLAQIRQQVLQQKQKFFKNQACKFSKSYKPKIINATSQQTKAFQKQKFQDSHILKNQNTKTSKSRKTSGNSGYDITNFINGGNKNFVLENYSSNYPNQFIGIGQTVQENGKDSKNSKNETKIGKFLKPKTYNLHENKFPQQDKFIIRSGTVNISNIVCNPSIPTPNYVISSHSRHVQSLNLNGQIMNYHQYNQLCSSVGNGMVTTQVQSNGYGAKNKIHVNQRHISSFINAKPSTSHKPKSTSVVFKTNSAPSKDNPVILKLIDKVKIKGYE